jgi:hypothetical protein
MFLCDDCHKNSGCNYGFLEQFSIGACEGCGKIAECFDCHGYNLRQNHTELKQKKPITMQVSQEEHDLILQRRNAYKVIPTSEAK